MINDRYSFSHKSGRENIPRRIIDIGRWNVGNERRFKSQRGRPSQRGEMRRLGRASWRIRTIAGNLRLVRFYDSLTARTTRHWRVNDVTPCLLFADTRLFGKVERSPVLIGSHDWTLLIMALPIHSVIPPPHDIADRVFATPVPCPNVAW